MPTSDNNLHLSIRPGEIVPATRAITATADDAIDMTATRGGIAVRGADGRTAADGATLTFTPADRLPAGRQTLIVEELRSPDGSLLTRGHTVDFTVVDTPADPGPEVAIESLVRLELTDDGTRRLPLDTRPAGRFVDVVKGEHRESRRPVRLAVDQDGREVDLDDHLAAVDKRRAARLGRLHPDLHRAFEEGADTVRVAIWLHQPDAERHKQAQRELREELDRRTGASATQRIATDRAGRRIAPRLVGELRASIAEVRARGLELARAVDASDPRADRLAPVVHATVTREQAVRLAATEGVSGLFLYDPRGVDDLTNSLAVANSDDVHATGTGGQGIRVAVFEAGPDDDSDLDVEDEYDATPSTSDHSRHVHGIIKNVESGAPNGHAPDCRLYSANSYDLDALAWAVNDQDCTVINQSFHRTSEATGSGLSFDDIYKDWLTLGYPWPLVVQAAGNTGEDGAVISPASNEYVNHKTYNHLTVGNHNDDASSMSSSTVFRNPASSFGDRELPELAANGTSVTTVGLTKSGTSMASPAVAGVAALVQSTHGSLEVWPEGTRAVLLAGATRNVRDDTWWDDVVGNVDGYDGSGAVNAQESQRIAQSRRWRNASGTQRGWDAGTLTSSDVDSAGLTTFRYRVTVPSLPFWFGPRHVKVALAWDSDVVEFPFIGLPIASVLDVDLDLKVFDASGNQVGYSGSWDNSYEIAEFTGSPGQTYDIHIRRWSGTRSVWYGLAWTVTGGLSLRWPFEVEFERGGTIEQPNWD